MAGTIVEQLEVKADAAWANLTRQLQGMESHLDRADSQGEWTAREVLAHLLFEPGRSPIGFLKSFSLRDLPLAEVTPGKVAMTEERRGMTLRQFLEALDAQRKGIFAYLATVSEADLQGRKARIPLFRQRLGTDEVPLHVFVEGIFNYHWNDHVGQLAKIRKAAGLPEAVQQAS